MSGDPLPAQAEDFLLWLSVERGRSTATLAAYRRDLRGFVDWLGEHGADLDSVGEDVIIDYLRHRQGLGLAPATVARSMVSVRSLFRFMVAEELRADDPTVSVEMPRVPRGPGARPRACAQRRRRGTRASFGRDAVRTANG